MKHQLLFFALAVRLPKSRGFSHDISRRGWLKDNVGVAAATAAVSLSTPQIASAVTGVADGNLPDLPPEATRSYLQYRLPLQLSADYFLWDLQDRVADTDEWGEINQLFRVNNNK